MEGEEGEEEDWGGGGAEGRTSKCEMKDATQQGQRRGRKGLRQ